MSPSRTGPFSLKARGSCCCRGRHFRHPWPLFIFAPTTSMLSQTFRSTHCIILHQSRGLFCDAWSIGRPIPVTLIPHRNVLHRKSDREERICSASRTKLLKFHCFPPTSGWLSLPLARPVVGSRSIAPSLCSSARLGHGSAQNAQGNYAGTTVGTAERPLANREASNKVDALWSAQHISEPGKNERRQRKREYERWAGVNLSKKSETETIHVHNRGRSVPICCLP